ncbi:HK97 gp10 family phage protein [Veillonella caviae]|uniref:HK97 gp10 family phage protein n=1 Tax=Veillonella caviae TaxID=248316 RepID=UPI000F8E489D|nr:HK97 gp10 family phage protein [Veillonella caviae]MCI5709276.1 HK97 gp10 family phage protein [Veillonella caviae]MDY5715642.1 HK97 gp10 family phage protein [Veillonella caviae]
MGAKINGFDLLNQKFTRILRQFPEHADTLIAQQGELLIADAKANTPRDTGTLQGNWKRTPVDNMSTEVYNNTEYANHVEYGHRTVKGGFVKGRKMLHRAVVHRKSVFLKDTRTIIRNLLEDD